MSSAGNMERQFSSLMPAVQERAVWQWLEKRHGIKATAQESAVFRVRGNKGWAAGLCVSVRAETLLEFRQTD